MKPERASSERCIVLDVPFELRASATQLGARYSKEHQVFLFIGATLPAALKAFLPVPYSFEHCVQQTLDGAAGRAVVTSSSQAPTFPDAGPTKLTPRPHQSVAIEAIQAARKAGLPGFLLADDVGLGKTLSAWLAIASWSDAQRVLVVAPLSVLAHWRRSIELLGDQGKTVMVLNYERLSKLFEVSPAAQKKVRSKKGLARAGTAADFDVVVWDESHRCKNPTAARSKFAAKLSARAGFSLWLSATAGQNPLELSYLAPLLAHTTGSRTKDLKDFEAWCQAQGVGLVRGAFGKWQWRNEGDDCHTLRSLLFDPQGGRPSAALRRRPEDIVGWPAINRILRPIELDSQTRDLYRQAWTRFRAELELAPWGKNPQGALAAALRLGQKSSLLRVAGSVELILELLDNGHQVAVSVAFKETLSALRTALGNVPCAEIHGGVALAAREAERLRFQRGEAKVVLFTVEEGISLHQGEYGDAPRSEVIHDLRWSAIQMAQIEGRCHRDGRFAQVYWAYAEDTIEEHIARVVARRLQSMKALVGDDTETLREIEALIAGYN